jgi:hypothetical protein
VTQSQIMIVSHTILSKHESSLLIFKCYITNTTVYGLLHVTQTGTITISSSVDPWSAELMPSKMKLVIK